MADGEGCKCHAHCEHECACDADWTPKEVYDLRAEVARVTAERDEARRELCIEHLSPEAEARRRGWDCFEKEVQS